MADAEDADEAGAPHSLPGSAGAARAGGPDKMFSLKKWNAVAMWSWDVECDTCAICRVQVMDACLRCQAENKQEDCVGESGEYQTLLLVHIMPMARVAENESCRRAFPKCQLEEVLTQVRFRDPLEHKKVLTAKSPDPTAEEGLA
ncbi:RING-box protein 2 [Willisornis vidua]|uniref:RING-box protein 2 n=1 Tax=Willisornis vidua TaxID=1566151 RepID=A0ABQ9D0H1_9PASS|nr:RING-box protein 2 [Willisornis vidua]